VLQMHVHALALPHGTSNACPRMVSQTIRSWRLQGRQHQQGWVRRLHGLDERIRMAGCAGYVQHRFLLPSFQSVPVQEFGCLSTAAHDSTMRPCYSPAPEDSPFALHHAITGITNGQVPERLGRHQNHYNTGDLKYAQSDHCEKSG